MGSLDGARWDASSYPDTAGRLRSSTDLALGGTICLEDPENWRGGVGTGEALESTDGRGVSLSVEMLKREGGWFPIFRVSTFGNHGRVLREVTYNRQGSHRGGAQPGEYRDEPSIQTRTSMGATGGQPPRRVFFGSPFRWGE